MNRLYCQNKCSISLSGENVQIFPSKKYDMTSMPNSTFDFANTFIIKQSRKQYLVYVYTSAILDLTLGTLAVAIYYKTKPEAIFDVRLHICNSTFDFGNTCSCKIYYKTKQ